MSINNRQVERPEPNLTDIFCHLYSGLDMPLYRPYSFKGFIGPPRHFESFKPESYEALLADIARKF